MTDSLDEFGCFGGKIPRSNCACFNPGVCIQKVLSSFKSRGSNVEA